MGDKVINLGSDTRQPTFSKGLTKLAILFDFKHPYFCLIYWPCQKSGMILVNKVVLELKLQKFYFNKKCTPKILFFIEEVLRKIRMIFDVENSL
jgi:hypothetical protein